VTTILDLGGGPGSWSIGFCQALPTAKAQIADLATSRQFAERNIQKAQLENRISFIDLDFTKDKIIGTFDLIWISHILHSLSPENSEKLLKKARAQLNPGGKIMIHEFILDEEKTSPQQAVFFSLNMLVMTSAGKAYSERELTVLLKKIGGTKIKRISLPDSIPSGVITANFL
jgi:cyclopropane fatty-acyl-phospholipid synthase-like methyltransferase